MQHRKFSINQITLALAIAFSASAVEAVGRGEIVSGSGSISKGANSTVVNQQSDRMIINWNDMDIGKQESMQFNQPGSDAAVLNRINATNPTSIQGALNANGQVFIVNPNGVLISKGATINVGSLIASSLNIKDSDFNQEELVFEGKGKGSVVNAGEITAEDRVALIGGGKVSNTGTIEVEYGQGVALASGEDIRLLFPYEEGISAQIGLGSLKALVENGGAIITPRGNIELKAWATDQITRSVINNTGTLEAATMVSVPNSIGIYLESAGSGRVDVAGKMRSDETLVRGAIISVKNNADVKTRYGGSTTFESTSKDGNVRLAKSQLHGNINIIADNVLVGGADDKPTFVKPGEINIIATSKNTTVGNKAINHIKQIVSGKGAISKDLVDAFREQKLALNISSDAGDLNLDNANLDYGNLRLKSRNVNINNKITGDALSIDSRGFKQATGADITMAQRFSVNTRNDIKQNGNIIAGESIDIKSAYGNVFQAAGQKTAAKKVSYSGKSLNLDGETRAQTLTLTADKYTQTANSSLVAQDELRLKRGDFNFTTGERDFRSISLNANSLNLATDKDTVINRGASLNGDLNIDSTADVRFSDLTVYGAATINANNIINGSPATHYRFHASKGATLSAKHDLKLNHVNAGVEEWRRYGYVVSPGIKGDVVLKGNNVTVDLVNATGDFTATASNAFTADSNISANNVNISAGNDVQLDGYALSAKGNVAIAGNNVKAASDSSITGGDSVALVAKSAMSINNVSARDVTLSAKDDIRASRVSAPASVKATSTAGSITFDVLNKTNSKMLNAGNGVDIKQDDNAPRSSRWGRF